MLRINVSPVQLADTDIAAQLDAALTAHGVAGESVCVELTENEPLRDPEAVAESLRRLRLLGRDLRDRRPGHRIQHPE